MHGQLNVQLLHTLIDIIGNASGFFELDAPPEGI